MFKSIWAPAPCIATPLELGARSPAAALLETGVPASDWYRRIVDMPLAALDAGDLARMLREGIVVERALVAAVCVLSLNPLAGTPGAPPGELLALVIKAGWKQPPKDVEKYHWCTTVEVLCYGARHIGYSHNLQRRKGYWPMIRIPGRVSHETLPSAERDLDPIWIAVAVFYISIAMVIFCTYLPIAIGLEVPPRFFPEVVTWKVVIIGTYLFSPVIAVANAWAAWYIMQSWRWRRACRSMAAVGPIAAPSVDDAPISSESQAVEIEPASSQTLREIGAVDPVVFEEWARMLEFERHEIDGYRQAFDMPISSLSNDLILMMLKVQCREAVILAAFAQLEHRPLASSSVGAPGELLAQLMTIGAEYWDEKPDQLAILRMLVWRARKFARDTGAGGRFVRTIEHCDAPLYRWPVFIGGQRYNSEAWM